MSDNTVGQFFDSLTDDYTAAIDRCIPRYREMVWALLDYLPQSQSVKSILELGCGTGNLSVLLSQHFPTASIHCVDVSGDSLGACRSRLGTDSRFTFEEADFRNLSYDEDSFDLILSSISIHHLTSTEKQKLFRQILRWLRADGVFGYADQFAGATDDLYARHIENWREHASDAGASDEEWQMWMQHQADHDHHDSLIDQVDWLREAGFPVVDAPWRYLLWTVVQARKELPP
jgi:tRNA (cmo5U34)-methyltransferase